MAYREAPRGGSRWFMILSLLAMAGALLLVGREVMKSRAAARMTAATATSSLSDSPGDDGAADGSGASDAPVIDEPPASETNPEPPPGSAATNPEAVRNQ